MSRHSQMKQQTSSLFYPQSTLCTTTMLYSNVRWKDSIMINTHINITENTRSSTTAGLISKVSARPTQVACTHTSSVLKDQCGGMIDASRMSGVLTDECAMGAAQINEKRPLKVSMIDECSVDPRTTLVLHGKVTNVRISEIKRECE